MSDDYKVLFEDAEKELARSMLNAAKSRMTIAGLNSACGMLEQGMRDMMVKLYEASVIVKELSDPMIDRYICQSGQSERCKCESCVRDRASKFVTGIGVYSDK